MGSFLLCQREATIVMLCQRRSYIFFDKIKIFMEMRGYITKWKLISFHATSQKENTNSYCTITHPLQLTVSYTCGNCKLCDSTSKVVMSCWSWHLATYLSIRGADTIEKIEKDFICLLPSQNQQKYVTSGYNQLQ